MDIDDLQRMMTGGAAPVHAMIIDDDEAPAAPEPVLTTVDEALGGKSATAAAKKALLRAEDVTEEALGDDPGDAHVLLSTRNAFAGIPCANEVAIANAEEERSALDKLLEPAGVRSSWLSPGASDGRQRRDDADAGSADGVKAEDAKSGDDDEGLPPLIYYDPNAIKTYGVKPQVRITFRGQRDRDDQVPPDLDLAIAIKECRLELKDQNDALDAIKDDLRQWEGAKFTVENGTVNVGRSKLPTYGAPVVDFELWENALDDDMRKALVRAGFVIMKYAKAEHHVMSVKTASSKSYALDAARSRGRAVIGATVKGNTVRGEACRYDVYES